MLNPILLYLVMQLEHSNILQINKLMVYGNVMMQILRNGLTLVNLMTKLFTMKHIMMQWLNVVKKKLIEIQHS